MKLPFTLSVALFWIFSISVISSLVPEHSLAQSFNQQNLTVGKETGVISQGDFQYPQVMYVSTHQASLHCGPADHYYQTENLQFAEEVQVYAKEPNGYLAIRPPATSYSLIEAENLEVLPQKNLAKVITNDTVAWIGANLNGGNSDVQNNPESWQWQVHLKRGEIVEIRGVLDRQDPENLGERKVWYKVAPPAGEFRWIHERSLQESLPTQKLELSTQSQNDSGQNRLAQATFSGEIVQGKNISQNQVTDQSTQTFREVTSQTAQHTSVPVLGKGLRAIEQHRSSPPTIIDQASRQNVDSWIPKTSPRRLSDSQIRSATAAGGVSQRVLQQEVATINEVESLQEIDLLFSKMVARPMAEWDLLPLQNRLQLFLQKGISLNEREKALALWERLDSFGKLQMEAAKVAQKAEEDRRRVTQSLKEQLFGESSLGEENVLKSLVKGVSFSGDSELKAYDGTGWLMEVVSRTGQAAPQYALLDDEGRLLSYVSPAAGLNLSRYVKKNVGVIGAKGYIPTLKKTHLTAQRIILLGRHQVTGQSDRK
ncbi:MAG: hypothetical protein MPJ24_05690 [Pirellulaceae bacterium]|nr:hypothetical protein [Pirellulaceae bacterium]